VTGYNHRLQVAQHEACHAIAAQQMGLPVAWVTIDPGCDEGVNFMAAVKVPEELIDRERDCFAICVAMAAPAHMISHHDFVVGRYARMEAEIAYEIGGRQMIPHDEIYERCSEIVDEHYVEILGLAERLLEEGTVVFDHAPA
jgi:hypothetical protein